MTAGVGPTGGYAIFRLYKSEPAQALSKEEQEWVDMLNKLDATAILDGADNEKNVNAMGQLIFNIFKKSGGTTEAGKKSCQRICDALAFTGDKDAQLRKSRVEAAWDRIGDDTFRWLH